MIGTDRFVCVCSACVGLSRTTRQADPSEWWAGTFAPVTELTEDVEPAPNDAEVEPYDPRAEPPPFVRREVAVTTWVVQTERPPVRPDPPPRRRVRQPDLLVTTFDADGREVPLEPIV